MEIQEAVSLGCETMHKRLTPLRMIRGVLCIIVLVSTASMMVLYPGFLSAVILRLFSLQRSRKAISFFFCAWLALWPLLFEKINKTRVIFSGDKVPCRERVLLISNHRTEVDWMYLWDFALRKGCLGYIRFVLKSSLMRLPVFGWAFHILEFIPVERRWEVDEKIMRSMLSTFKNHSDPLWLVLFPEGTDYTEQKCVKNQKIAAEKGLPVLKNVLLPRSKGFWVCLEDLRGSLDAVYDVTIGYKHCCPSFLDNVFGLDPAEVHIHVRRVSPRDIPTSQGDISAWLMDTYSLKDKLLSQFYAGGSFPGAGTEADLSTMKCLINFIFVIVLTTACTYLTFFSSVLFKVYVTLACIYLASATYLNVRPTEILSFIRPCK